MIQGITVVGLQTKKELTDKKYDQLFDRLEKHLNKWHISITEGNTSPLINGVYYWSLRFNGTDAEKFNLHAVCLLFRKVWGPYIEWDYDKD